MTVLEVENLKKHFPIRAGVFLQVRGWVRALEETSLTIEEDQVVGVVGESGCGKTTLAKTIAKIIEPTSGVVRFHHNGRVVEVTSRVSREDLALYRRNLQMVYQNPFDSLDPRMSILEIVAEPLRAHEVFKNKKEEREYVSQIIERVGLERSVLERYPHEFSGGQRQRIAIARAIALRPKLVICDEPTSALDVSVQNQIVNLLMQLREEFKMSYLFISHNLDLIHYVSDRVYVMYLGNVVEEAAATELFERPMHPYTYSLMGSIPSWDPRRRKLATLKLEGEPPSPINPPPGCPFHPRCAYSKGRCKVEKPKLEGEQHKVACFYPLQG